jgi:hypothetical protein
MEPTLRAIESYRKQNFYYTTGWSVAMAGVGQVANEVLLVSNDAPFLCFYTTATVRQGIAGAEVIVLDWAGDIVWHDNVIGTDLMNEAMPLEALAGNGRDPYNLPPPRVFHKATTLTFTFTSNVATRTQVNITLHGAKLL